MKTLAGLAELHGVCDGLLVDQFGTLHDGTTPYPGAVPGLARLRQAGIAVVLLSNSGKRAAPNAQRLEAMGIPRRLYDAFVTSGEAGWRMLAEQRLAGAEGVRRCLLLARGEEGAEVLNGTPLAAVRAENAELVVIAGSEGDRRTLASYRAQLAPLAAAGIAAICLNPDRIMLTPDGPAFGAGRIAEEYAALGGAVTWVGKPYGAIYDEAMAELPGLDRARVAGVGDSVEHDVVGARDAGCRAVLVRQGIAAGASDAEIEAECQRRGAWPDASIERFAWQIREV